jgi:hypothetical protein
MAQGGPPDPPPSPTPPAQRENGWVTYARWQFTSRWGVRLVVLTAGGIVLAFTWQRVLGLALTAFGIALVIAVTVAILPKKAKKKL